MYTRNFSFTICVSVIRNVVGSPLTPVSLYRSLSDSLRSSTLKFDVTDSCMTSMPAMKADRRESDCLPEPPTPMSMALPEGFEMMRQMRQTARIVA